MFVKSIIFALVTLVISSHGVPFRSVLEGAIVGGSSSPSVDALASGAILGSTYLGSGSTRPQIGGLIVTAHSGGSSTGEVV